MLTSTEKPRQQKKKRSELYLEGDEESKQEVA
jgi:hypothetical protein